MWRMCVMLPKVVPSPTAAKALVEKICRWLLVPHCLLRQLPTLRCWLEVQLILTLVPWEGGTLVSYKLPFYE